MYEARGRSPPVCNGLVPKRSDFLMVPGNPRDKLELKETDDRIDGSIVFNLLQKISSYKQGGLPVSGYYHKLNSLWRGFDILTKLPDYTYVARNELVDLGKMLKLMQFLMGLDDIYQPIRSNILTREILLEVKDAFVIVSREESHRGIPPSSVKTDKPQASAFMSRQFDNNNNWSNNGNNVNKGVYDSLLCKNCDLKGHTIDRCFEIIGYPPGFKRNPNLKSKNNFNNNKSNNMEFNKASLGNNDSKTSSNVSFTNEHVLKLMSILNDKSCSAGQSNMAGISKWIIDSEANQHMTNSTKDMVDLVDVSDLKLTVGHPNGTLAKYVRNLKSNSDVMLFNVLVIPEYTVSLLSVHKLIKARKFSVGFDETKCYIQDLRKERVLGTGNEFGGLYLFDKEYNKSDVSNYKSKPKTKSSRSPNDDEKGPSGRDVSVHQPDLDDNLDQPGSDEQRPHSGSDSSIPQPRNDELNTATPIYSPYKGDLGFS
ncbi:hypothetical protein Tco_0693153 [Tanacetum coccineum]